LVLQVDYLETVGEVPGHRVRVAVRKDHPPTLALGDANPGKLHETRAEYEDGLQSVSLYRIRLEGIPPSKQPAQGAQEGVCAAGFVRQAANEPGEPFRMVSCHADAPQLQAVTGKQFLQSPRGE